MNAIMVPLDGSAFAEQALPLAMTLARRSNSRIHLTLAAAPASEITAAAAEYLSGMAARLESGMSEGVTYSVLTPDPGAPAWPMPACSSVADVLARYVVDQDIGLVVLTTHGRGGVRRAWLGSTADAFVRIAPRPVLLVRPGDEEVAITAADFSLRHVVIPLDGSETSERAIPIAQEIGSLFGARYTLVRVVVPFTPDISTEWYGVHPFEPTLNLESAARYLANVANSMRERGLNVATQVIESSSPAGAIIDYATSQDAGLIVLMSSGAGGIRRLLLGSVADKVVRSGSVSVLVCNTQYVVRSAGVRDAPASASVSPV